MERHGAEQFGRLAEDRKDEHRFHGKPLRELFVGVRIGLGIGAEVWPPCLHHDLGDSALDARTVEVDPRRAGRPPVPSKRQRALVK